MGKHKLNFLHSTALPVMLSFALVSCDKGADPPKDAQQHSTQAQEIVINVDQDTVANDVDAQKDKAKTLQDRPDPFDRIGSGAEHLQKKYYAPPPFIPGREPISGTNDSDTSENTENAAEKNAEQSSTDRLSEIRDNIDNGDAAKYLNKEHMFPPPFIPGRSTIGQNEENLPSPSNSQTESTLSKAMHDIMNRISTDSHKFLEKKHNTPPPFVPEGNEPE